MIFYDSETTGLCGPAILLQYAIDDGPVILHEFWTEPFQKSLDLIEKMMSHEGGLVGFNLSFDQFQLCKIYTMFDLFMKRNPNLKDDLPENYIDELGVLEKEARDGPCLKPVKACDVMLHARKGPYQSTMPREDIRIKRVPVFH
jgi:hypothetical protein